MIRVKILILSVLLIIGVPAIAFAHAHLVSSSPAVGATASAPTNLEMTFSEGIELGLSKFELTGPTGLVGGVSVAFGGDNKTVQLHLSAPLPAGSYTIRWHVVSVDTHRTEGTFSFSVK